jgi:hypothetical protein
MNITRTAATPASASLFNPQEDIVVEPKSKDVNNFLSVLMKLMYVAKRTRPDILLALSFLATRSSNPTDHDWKGLYRVLAYLNGTKHLGIRYHAEDLVCTCYCDASYACHTDAKGHSGVLFMLGGGPILFKSSKQKLVSRSSTESELIALDQGVCDAIIIRELLR